jgi:sortase (surface protein transpeptidase)
MTGDIVQGRSAQELRRRKRPMSAPSPAPGMDVTLRALSAPMPGQRMDGLVSHTQKVNNTLAAAAPVVNNTIVAGPPVRSMEMIPQKRREVRSRTKKIVLPITPMVTPVIPVPSRTVHEVPVIKTQPSVVLRRQSVSSYKANLASKLVGAKAGRTKGQYAIMAMAIFVFGIGLAVSISTLQTNHSAKAQVSAISNNAEQGGDAASGSSTTPPSEVKPSPQAVTSYAVAPDLPRYIAIDKLKVHARIKPMTVLRDGSLQAPNSIYDAGWYNASAKPGDAGSNGAMLIDGHVLGATYPAVFSKIKTLVGGDLITVTRGDGQVFTYKVVKVQNYDADTLDVGMLLTSIQPGRAGLNLITCGGKYLAKKQTFDQRTVVFTVQI